MAAFEVKFDMGKFKRDNARLMRSVIPQATARGLNNLAYEARKALQQEMRDVFDRPTPYIVSSPKVAEATPELLESKVSMPYKGGKGIDPEKVLRAEIEGGPRRLKRFEVALSRAGILPAGHYAVPGTGAPLDPYGNVSGPFIVKLISYLQASGEQGFRANMTAKRIKALGKVGKTASGFKTIGGVQYFATHGKLRGGHRGAHLAPGIWTRSGTHGVNLEPIIMFVRQPTYAKRLDVQAIGQRVVETQGSRQMTRALDYELRKASAAGGSK